MGGMFCLFVKHKTGIRQGCVISLDLFTVSIDDVLVKLHVDSVNQCLAVEYETYALKRS